MSPKFLRFLLRLAIFTLFLAIAGALLYRVLPEGTMTVLFYPLLLLFFLVNLGVHYILLRVTKLSPRKFVSYFMLTTFGKLMLYIILVFAYLLTRPADVMQFVISFLAMYILFTAFEVVSLLRQSGAVEKEI